MKYGLIPENQLEEDALRSNPTAQAMFDPILPVLQARSLMAAVRLGVFEEMGDGTRGAGELAGELGLDDETMDLLLRVLTCSGYLSYESNRYGLTEVSRLSFLSASRFRLSSWVELNRIHWEAVAGLEKSLKTGEGVDLHEQLVSDRDWRVYQEAMLETARPAADWVASHVPVREGAESMLDIGGSHGLYSAMICRRNPPLCAEIVELPEAIEHAQELARQEGIDDVVRYRLGDAMALELGSQVYDAIFLGNILHHFTEDQSRRLLSAVRSALKPGGTAAIWDLRIADANSSPDLVGDGFALLFRITSSSRCHTTEQYSDWMRAAGMSDIEVTPTASHVLITGRVK